VIQALLESRKGSLAAFTGQMVKVPQIIASAYVSQGPRLSKAELAELEKTVLQSNPGLIRINLRYSGTEPLYRVMMESDGKLTENDLAALAVEICRQAQTVAGVTDGHIDILNSTRGGVMAY
jgi:phosphomannomutase